VHTKPGGFSISAYDSAIRAAGGSGFSRDFARFSRDVAEWRTARTFPEAGRFRDVARQGNLPAGGRTLVRLLNHTTAQLLRIPTRVGRGVVVRATAPVGTAAGLALVGRIGSERGGRIVSKLRFKQAGGRMTVRLTRLGRFDRATAVLINADASAFGYNARLLDWRYLRDAAPFTVSAGPLP
jgi:hypothetical protein